MARPSPAGAVRRFLPKYLHALVAIPFLFTVGILSRKHRFLIFQIAQHFGFKMPQIEMLLPTLPLDHLLAQPIKASLLEPLSKDGNVALLELLVIANLARDVNPAVAFEIGTFDGRTTLNIAANLPLDGVVYTLDLPQSEIESTTFKLAPGESNFVDKPVPGERFATTGFSARIHQLYGDSATFDFSPYDGKIDLVFVDGSHAYEYVRNDSAAAMKMLAPGGIILWHDYQPDWPGVIQALNQLFGSNPKFASLGRIEGTSLVMLRREDTRRST